MMRRKVERLARVAVVAAAVLALLGTAAWAAGAHDAAPEPPAEGGMGNQVMAVGHTHDTDGVTAALIEGLMTGGTAFVYITLAAMLPLFWVMTLVVHLARPYVLRNLKKFTLRFGADVWWLTYVMLRDAVMVLTFCLSVFFLFPNLLLGLALPVTGPIATVLLFWALAIKLTRRADDSARDFRAVTWLVVAGATVYLVPFILGVEAPMHGWERWRALASSVENPRLALGSFYVAAALFFATGGYIATYVVRQAVRSAASAARRGAVAAGYPPPAGATEGAPSGD